MTRIRWIFFLLVAVLLASCASQVTISPTAASATVTTMETPLPATPTSSPTSTAPIPTHTSIPVPSPTPANTVGVKTPPPAGVFSLIYYPPLVMDYNPALWRDKSQYKNKDMLINFLQSRQFEGCTIDIRGASGFYPANMQTIRLGNIDYQVYPEGTSSSLTTITIYFAGVPNDAGAPVIEVDAGQSQAAQCNAKAQAVLATLRRSDQPVLSFCEQLALTYQPQNGFKTYCDDYLFAFDYPADWQTILLSSAIDRLAAANVVRKAQRFYAEDGSNSIRADTYRFYSSMPLPDRVQAYFAYEGREFPSKDYPSLKIGGQRAYAIVKRWHQDYSAVYLFFRHGDFYTVIELKAPNRTALDFNWTIARSIQIPGSTPADNVIPDELIKDSYTLVQ